MNVMKTFKRLISSVRNLMTFRYQLISKIIYVCERRHMNDWISRALCHSYWGNSLFLLLRLTLNLRWN